MKVIMGGAFREIGSFGKTRERGEKMRELLMIKALQERDLLRDRIFRQIETTTFLDYKKQSEERTVGTMTVEAEFCERVKSSYQSIQDLIRNYDEIDAAIVSSNAATVVKTKFGEYTVAAAIALKQRLKNSTGSETSRLLQALDKKMMPKCDFESEMLRVMQKQLMDSMEKMKAAQTSLEAAAEQMRSNILGSEKAKKDSASIAVVDEYLKANQYKLVDPLDLSKRIQQLKAEREELLNELDTAIKISNATTTIVVDF